MAESEELLIRFTSAREIKAWIDFIVSREEALTEARTLFNKSYRNASASNRAEIDQWMNRGIHTPYTRKLERRLADLTMQTKPSKSHDPEIVRILKSVATGENLGLLSEAIEDEWLNVRGQ